MILHKSNIYCNICLRKKGRVCSNRNGMENRNSENDLHVLQVCQVDKDV